MLNGWGWCRSVGNTVERDGVTGTFLGVDERFGMLIRDADSTHLLPVKPFTGRSDMKLARAVHFDDSDTNGFSQPGPHRRVVHHRRFRILQLGRRAI